VTVQARLHRDPYATRTVTIVDVCDELEGIATYQLAFVDEQAPDEYAFAPGQFNMLYLPGVGEIAISMSGDPAGGGPWVHTIRVAGNVTKTLATYQVGATLGLRGPFGTPWPVEHLCGQDLLIVAGGVGLAPLRPLIFDVLRDRAKYGRVRLVMGARTPDGLLFRREYDRWRDGGIEMDLTVDQAMSGWTGNIGVVTLILDRMRLLAPERTHVVTCGPEVMMRYVAASAMRRGITMDRIWVSLERNMQCAAALCGHCQLGPAFVCKDGPVFRYDVMRPFLFTESL
jgi:NAD(P)H-flavin reductase